MAKKNKDKNGVEAEAAAAATTTPPQAEAAGATADGETAIEPVAAAPLSTEHTELPAGFDDWDEGDRILPRFAIMQNTSRYEDNEPGKFRNNLDPTDHREKIRMVAIVYHKGMVLWSEEQGEDPLCRSFNALAPDLDIESPKGEQCHRRIKNRLVPVCNYAKWHASEPPRCKKTYTIIGLDLDNDEAPFFVSFHGTSVRPVRGMISRLWQTRMPLFSQSMTLSLSKTTNAKGTFYVAAFGNFERVDDEALVRYQDIYQGLRDLDLQRSIEANEEGAEGEGTEGAGGAESDPMF